MKGAVFSMYERGTFDMALWLRFAEHEHLLRFVVEQFPPLDFMASFGQGMMTSFLRVAKTPSDLQYGQDVITSGQIAKSGVGPTTGTHCHPSMNAQARHSPPGPSAFHWHFAAGRPRGCCPPKGLR